MRRGLLQLLQLCLKLHVTTHIVHRTHLGMLTLSFMSLCSTLSCPTRFCRPQTSFALSLSLPWPVGLECAAYLAG